LDLQQLIERLVGCYFLAVHQWLFETTDGRITWLGGLPALLLRTTGRKTGAERTAALVYLEDGKDLVVVASKGGSDRPPAWLLTRDRQGG
jgi:F420H(2)-dependent quinone reductase